MAFSRLKIAALTLGLGLGVSACGGSSVDKEVAQVQRAVVDAPAVTVQDVSTVSGSTSTISGIASATSADLTITTLPASGTVRIVKRDKVLYVSGDPGAVAGLLSLNPTRLQAVGRKWILVASSDEPFNAISKSLTPVGLVQPFLAKTPTLTSLLATAASKETAVLSGPWQGDGPTNGWKGFTSLRVDPATSLPRSGLIELHHNGDIATRAAVFSSWTSPMIVTVPTVFVSYASISA